MTYRSKRWREEAKSTVVLGGLGYLAALQIPEFLKTIREGLYNARHAYRTGKEIMTGGPEGMKAAKNLEEALAMVESAAQNNQEAKQALEGYFVERKDLLKSLVGVYQENETLAREAERLEVQLKGMLKNFFELGNELKPDWWKENIDRTVIKLYGMDPVKAVEKSERLKAFYENFRKFCDGREQNENTVKEICDNLAQFKRETNAQNDRINSLFPGLIERVRETYEKEDHIFERDDLGARLTRQDLEKTIEEVSQYKKNVQQTEMQVSQEVVIQPYRSYNWVDAVTNPVTLGIAGALLMKGASKLLPYPMDRGITWITAAPINTFLNLGRRTGKGFEYLGREIVKGIRAGADRLIKKRSP